LQDYYLYKLFAIDVCHYLFTNCCMMVYSSNYWQMISVWRKTHPWIYGVCMYTYIY
jgi:hypothetical protein